MREIKFRAWDIEGKKMVDLHKITPLALVDGINHSGKGLYLPLGEAGTRLIFEQYTGLNDKNGVEIYEGDIITHINQEADHTPYAIPEISPNNWDTLLSVGDSEWHMGENQYSNIEVIGNIHENPELLEKK